MQVILNSEDMHTSKNMSDSDRLEFYINIKSGAESGWDFSSRWYIVDEGHSQGNLSHISTRNILPVDLNAFVCLNAKLLSKLFGLVGDEQKAQYYQNEYSRWKTAIQEVCCAYHSYQNH